MRLNYRVTVETSYTGMTTLNVRKATHEDSGKYTVVVTNDVGKATADFNVAITGKIPDADKLHSSEWNY